MKLTIGTAPENGDELPLWDNGACVASVWPMGEDFDLDFPGPNQAENARRIVASVNLLAGYRVEQLEVALDKLNGTDTYFDLFVDGELQ